MSMKQCGIQAATTNIDNLNSNAFASIGKGNRGSENLSLPKQSKKERAYHFILSNPKGVTENDILINVRLSSGRNYFTELERKYGFKFIRLNQPNPDGIGCHFKYVIESLKDAKRILQAINKYRVRRKALFLPAHEAEMLLLPYLTPIGER